MAFKRRKYARRSYKKRPRGRRVASKARKRRGKQLATKAYVRKVVPRPEMKYFLGLQNNAKYAVPSTWIRSDAFSNAFAIPSGPGLHQRIGDEVMLKMIELEYEVSPQLTALTSRERLQVSGGAAGFGNVINTVTYDQEIRAFMITSNMDPGTGLPLQDFPQHGSTQSFAPGGASNFHLSLDMKDIKAGKRKVHMQAKHKVLTGKQPGVTGDFTGAATAPAVTTGAQNVNTVKKIRKVFKFPGRGMKLSYDSSVTAVPVRLPVLYFVGKNAAIDDNPYVRMCLVRLWYTDP